MRRMVLTPELIGAATLDAGNRSMRAAGRTKWTVDDSDAAAAESNRLWDIYDAAHPRTLADLWWLQEVA